MAEPPDQDPETPAERRKRLHREEARRYYHANKEASLARNKAWRAKNYEYAIQKGRESFAKNRERENARRMARYEATREESKEKFRANYAKNRERYNALGKIWHAENKETANAGRRERYRKMAETNPDHLHELHQRAQNKARQVAPWKALVKGAIQRAALRGIECSLTADWGAARWTGRCEVTDLPFVLTRRGMGFRNPYAPSIDRINPAIGYTPENSRFILWAINAFKGEWSDADMMIIARVLVSKSMA